MPRPSLRARRKTGTAASDMASAPSAWTIRNDVSTSSKSQAGAVRSGWRRAGKLAETPRISGRPLSASERPSSA